VKPKDQNRYVAPCRLRKFNLVAGEALACDAWHLRWALPNRRSQQHGGKGGTSLIGVIFIALSPLWVLLALAGGRIRSQSDHDRPRDRSLPPAQNGGRPNSCFEWACQRDDQQVGRRVHQH